MDESLPLRRSTRNSVVLKNEEKESVTLTPRKKKVSTPVKVEPSTPSRRTRASSATPKKNLIESMSTPKKTLPVLNEEENVGTVPGTPSRKTKEISPKTPSRRRVVRESISTPTTKASTVDKTTKKPVETAEDTTVVATRPLTRAKRKTMGADILVPDTTKTSEPEKGVQNKKEKPEPEKKVQNKKDKTTSPRIDDKINTSPDNKSKGKQDKSCSALVPKIVLTDVKKQQAKEAKIPENVVDGDQCRVFTTKSPVRAEDVAINSPRKVPENCKSNSEVSLKSDADYISTRSREIKADSVNSISPVESTDLNSVEQGNHDSSINTKLDSDIVAKSPQIVTVSKDEDIPNIVITSPSPRKFTDSKDNNVPNIVIKCPSPQKATDSNGKNIPNIVIKCPSPQKDTDLNDKNIPNIVVTFPSPQKFSDSKENIKNDADSSSTSEQRNASPSKNETDSSDVKEKDMTPETSKSVNVDPEVSNTTEEKNLSSVEKEAEIRTTSSPEKINENIIKSSIKQKNDCVENDLVQTVMQVSTVETPLKIKENVPVVETAQIENKDSEELNKTFDKDNSNEHVAKDVSANKSDSKDLTDEDSFNLKSSNLDTSFLNKNSGESSPVDDSTIASNIPVAKEATMEAETTEKDSESTDEATSPCSPKIYMPSTSKVGSTEVMSSQTPSPNKAMPSTSKVGSTEATSSSSSNNMAPSTSKDENVNKTSMEANTAKNNGEEVGESSKEANNGSGINNATTSKEGDKPEAKSNSPSPEFPIQICNHRAPCDCYVSDDSMDSGIQNDDYDILLRFRNFSRFQNAYRQRLNSRRNVAPNEPEVEVPDIENLSEGTLDGSENKSTEGEVSEVKVSPEKSDDLKDDTLLVWKGDDLPKIAEPAEDGTDKNTGLDEILMSPKDFLKSDDESNVDCEKVDSRSEGVKEISNENKPLEEVANARVDPQSASGAHDDISSDVTHSAKDSSTKVDEKESDSGADHCKPSISETQDSVCTDVTPSNDAVQSSEDGTSKVVEEPGDSIIDRCKPSVPETQDNISSDLTQSNTTITKDNVIKVDKEESEDVNNKQSISEVKENTSCDVSHGNEADLTCEGTSIKVGEKEDDVDVDHRKSSEPGNISLYLTISSEAVQSSEDTSTTVDEKEDCDSHKSSKTKGQEMISSGLTPSTEGSSTKVEEVQNDGDADDSKQLTSGTEDNINLDVTKSIDVQSSEGLNKPKVNVEQDRADVNNLESSESDMQENINMDVTLSNEPSTEDSSNKVDEKEVDRHKMSSTETQESISSKFTESNDVQSSEDSSNIDEKQADSDVPAKSTFEVEINTSTNIPSDSKSETVPNDSEVSDKLKEICVDQEKEGSKDKSESVSVNDITEPVSVNDITEPVSVNDITEPVSVKDITEKAKADDSNQIIKSEINVQEESLDNSQSVCSHKEEEEEIKNGKSIETDLKIKDSEDKKENFVSPIKNKKSVENKSKKVSKKLDSETEDSELESEADSEYSNDPPSNAATEGSDRPMSGKDFIDFEAEEGEETSEDESFIAPSESESSSSDAELIQSFKMKLRKRKRNLEAASPKSDNYLDSVQRLFDSSENFLKDDDSHEEEEESVKVKKMKLEKEEAASNLNKKKRKPKSILKTQCTIVDSTESRSKNKVIREPSKTGVFIVSSISQDSEGPRVSRNISKGSKLRTGSKKSKFSDYESVAKGFNDSVAEDAALRGFVVTYDDSHLVAKKPRKAAAGWSESVIVKNKMKEGKNLKKNVKKSLRRDDIDETDAPNIVTLIMPYKMSIKSVSSVLTDLGISDISSVDIPKPKVAVVEFSSRESFKKILKLYGELKINDKPIYILEGCSLV